MPGRNVIVHSSNVAFGSTRLGEVRDHHALVVGLGEGVVHRLRHHDPRDRQLGAGEAEARRAAFEAVDDLPAGDRLAVVARRPAVALLVVAPAAARGYEERERGEQGKKGERPSTRSHAVSHVVPPVWAGGFPAPLLNRWMVARNLRSVTTVVNIHSRTNACTLRGIARVARMERDRRGRGRRHLSGSFRVTALLAGSLHRPHLVHGAVFRSAVPAAPYARLVPSDRLRVSGSCVIGLDELEWRFSGVGRTRGSARKHREHSRRAALRRRGIPLARSPPAGPDHRAARPRRPGGGLGFPLPAPESRAGRWSACGRSWRMRYGSSAPGCRPG